MDDEEWDDTLLHEIDKLEAKHAKSLQMDTSRENRDSIKTDQENVREDVWSCSFCTFLNSGTQKRCQMCGQFSVCATRAIVKKKTHQLNLQCFLSQTNGSGLKDESESDKAEFFLRGEDAQAKLRYISSDEETKTVDIDEDAAVSIIYPTNRPIREYQLHISEKALYHNTLVALPTGLGKTLIASVVMYNFYRWFPSGKVVFMAPTKPLVNQQIQACHEVMRIPLRESAELQGNIAKKHRKVLWKEKRVFFCTPQSFTNDLISGTCADPRSIVCLVVDEAHRARKNYAYCTAIRELRRHTNFFRILALSATPGSKFEGIQDVVQNLDICHIESRTLDDADVKRYSFERKEEIIKCPLSENIKRMEVLLLKAQQKVLDRLVQKRAVPSNVSQKLTRYQILQLREFYRDKKERKNQNHIVEGDFFLLISLSYARNLLVVHGLKVFEGFLVNWQHDAKSPSWSKRDLLESKEFTDLVEFIKSIQRTSLSEFQDHSKLSVLREVLIKHFCGTKQETRAIVFTQYRSSVGSIVSVLSSHSDILKVERFVGQSSTSNTGISVPEIDMHQGQSQKVQKEIIAKFKSGEVNTLVATCIAEEGLDIGQVDLIVLFDTVSSPIRMIQRMGRTGRKRIGKVILLVTEGDEEQKLTRSLANARNISKALTSDAIKSRLQYGSCSRMIPNNFTPQLVLSDMDTLSSSASKAEECAETLPRISDVCPKWRLDESQKQKLYLEFATSTFRGDARKKFCPIILTSSAQNRRISTCSVGTESILPPSIRSLKVRALMRFISGDLQLAAKCARVHLQSVAVPIPAICMQKSSILPCTPTEAEDDRDLNCDFAFSASPLCNDNCADMKMLSPVDCNIDEAYCCICGLYDSLKGNLIVFCDGCNVALHQNCYGIDSISGEKDWFCEACNYKQKHDELLDLRCELCPFRSGALKRTQCDKWAHVQCFLWVPELSVEALSSLSFALGKLSALDPDRKELQCGLCHSNYGPGVIQCAKKRCLEAFHVSCAFQAPQYSLVQLAEQIGEEREAMPRYLAYCAIHSKHYEEVDNLSVNGIDDSRDTLLSPSVLLATQLELEGSRHYRRLKRRAVSPADGTELKRKGKRQRERLRFAAKLFVEEDVEVSGDSSAGDEYEDQNWAGSSDSFINDTSQLLYSQPARNHQIQAESDTMRAIYAKSLMDSPDPVLSKTRRNGRIWHTLPKNGIISSCLQNLKTMEANQVHRNANNDANKGLDQTSHTAPDSECRSSALEDDGRQSVRRLPDEVNLGIAGKAKADERRMRMEENRLQALKRLRERTQTSQTDNIRRREATEIVLIRQNLLSTHPELRSLLHDFLDCMTEIPSLDVDILLSFRVGVVLIKGSQYKQSMNQSPDHLLALSRMHQKLIICFLSIISSDEAVDNHLGKLSAEVMGHYKDLCQMSSNIQMVETMSPIQVQEELLRIAREEAVSGFALSRLVIDDASQGESIKDMIDGDENFEKRLQFFRACPALTLDGAISLTFRFKGFAVDRIPVRKFNVKHWKRMIPIVTECTAASIAHYFLKAMS